MASHIRYIAKIGGGWYSGAKVLERLGMYTNGRIRTVAEAKQAAKHIKAELWVIREPRRVAARRSRYKKFCTQLGIGRKKPSKWAPPVPVGHDIAVQVGGLFYAGNVPQQGLAGYGELAQQHYAALQAQLLQHP